MSLDPDTPANQYAKLIYSIRIVARIPRHVNETTMSYKNFEKEGFPQRNFIMRGTTLCALDVTMAHGAAMYAAGRLLDNIRNPFNASVIRAEMDALRDRNKADVSPEDVKSWESTVKKGSEWYGLEDHDPKSTRSSVPYCPYLFQLAWKSFYVGNKPAYWCGAREFGTQNQGYPPLHAVGRAGADPFEGNNNSDPTVFLYVDVSSPLEPRYAFMLQSDVARVEFYHLNEENLELDANEDVTLHPLRAFNAQDMGEKYVIPETEWHTDFEEFGENKEEHLPGQPGRTRRSSLSQLDPEEQSKIRAKPEYVALCESRKTQAREHPAVVRMMEFGWLSKDDILRPDGTALLQEVWDAARLQSSYGNSLTYLLDQPHRVLLAEPKALDSPNPQPILPWNTHLVSDTLVAQRTPGSSLAAIAADAYFTKVCINPAEQGGILTQVATLGRTELAARRLELVRRLWSESAKGGSEDLDKTYQWLHFRAPEELEDFSKLDYADADSLPDSSSPRLWSVMFYQALCYRDTVARERRRRNSENTPMDIDENIDEHVLFLLYGNKETPGLRYCSHNEYPGQSLGDVAHPAFDVSQFPQMREEEIICSLKLWSEHVWMPDLARNDWSFQSATHVPIRTLNVSGCYYVTRNTIKRALHAVPTITRIIAIACPNLTEYDVEAISLGGTLDNIDCILTIDMCRGPFRRCDDKAELRDKKIKRVQSLLPAPPNDEVKKAMDAVPGVCFGTTPSFKFQYHSVLRDLYVPQGWHGCRPTHTFARPPALGFDPETHKVVCGPPRFSVILDSNWGAGSSLTGATLPRIPIDFGFDSAGTNGSGLTAIWQGIVDLIEFLWFDKMRNVQRQDSVSWSLLVKSCFSGSGVKWGTKGGLAGGSEFYGFPAYFKGGPGQANEEWAFVYKFRDSRAKVSVAYTSNSWDALYPQKDLQDAWAFIRYGRDADVLSQYVPTVVIYDVRGFRQAVCPEIPISADEAKWIDRVEDLLENGAWAWDHAVTNVGMDRSMMQKGDPMLNKMKRLMQKLSKPQFMKTNPQEVVHLIDRIIKSNMNDGKDMF